MRGYGRKKKGPTYKVLFFEDTSRLVDSQVMIVSRNCTGKKHEGGLGFGSWDDYKGGKLFNNIKELQTYCRHARDWAEALNGFQGTYGTPREEKLECSHWINHHLTLSGILGQMEDMNIDEVEQLKAEKETAETKLNRLQLTLKPFLKKEGQAELRNLVNKFKVTYYGWGDKEIENWKELQKEAQVFFKKNLKK